MVAYAVEQGLGYLAKSFYDAGVVQRVLIVRHGSRANYPEWYGDDGAHVDPRGFAGPEVDKFLEAVDVVLCFETIFDWKFPARCRRQGVKTVCVPMYEWFPEGQQHVFDGYLCPSVLDQDYFPGSPLFQPPVDSSTWKLRTTAKRYLHNAGNVGCHWHKGTLELLQAMAYVESDLVLTVRAQDVRELNKVLMRVPEVRSNPKVDVQPGAIPYGELFADHDVYVAPEKRNGLSLPLQEAYAAGLLVITTDRYPINTWLPREPLIPVDSVRRARIGRGYLAHEESVVSPRTIAATMDEWYGRDITEYSNYAGDWARANSWKAKRQECLRLLEGFCERT
jgi:glycosyltransferase involved in cell wall biosynthesis